MLIFFPSWASDFVHKIDENVKSALVSKVPRKTSLVAVASRLWIRIVIHFEMNIVIVEIAGIPWLRRSW